MDKSLEKVGSKTQQQIYDFLVDFITNNEWLCTKRKRNLRWNIFKIDFQCLQSSYGIRTDGKDKYES